MSAPKTPGPATPYHQLRSHCRTTAVLLAAGYGIALAAGWLYTSIRSPLCIGLLFAGLAVVLGGVAYALWTVRCPFCGYSLAGCRPLPKACPRCEKRLDEPPAQT